MKASELRIGNTLRSRLTGNVFNVSAVDIVNINEEPDNVEPIPLTEEWLIKVGFKKFGKSFDLRFKGICISVYFCSDDKIIGCYIENVGIKVYYIYQLQNLYFALTGEELTIKS